MIHKFPNGEELNIKDINKNDLVPDLVFESLQKTFAYGAEKYEPHDWMINTNPQDHIGAILRHLGKHIKGEIFDEESGNRHLDHVLTRAAMLMYLSVKGGDTDDI